MGWSAQDFANGKLMDSTPVETITQYWVLSAFWHSYDLKVQVIFAVLLILAGVALYVIQTKLIEQQISLGAGRRVRMHLTTVDSVAELIQQVDSRGEIFRTVAEAG